MTPEMTLVIVPVYNESPTQLNKVVADLVQHGFDNICIVDDGSAQIVDTKGTYITVIRHAVNRGKGAAVKTGMEFAKHRGVDIIVTIDGDGQHSASDIKPMIDKIEQGYDVVLGSRYLEKQDLPLTSVIRNKIANGIIALFFGLRVNDSQSGLRAFSQQALHKIDTRSDRYAYDSEVIMHIKKHKLRYCEVPIHVRYTVYSMSKNTKQGFINGVKTFIRLFHL